MTTILTETTHTGGYLVSEASGNRSREVVTVAAGQTLAAGAVLGKLTSSGEYVAFDPDASDGSETAVAICYAPVDASAGAQPAVITARSAEVNGAELVWPVGIEPAAVAAATAALRAQGIIPR